MKSPLRIIRGRLRAPRHGTVVAYIALTLAAAVPASAALSVTSADIVNGQVKQVDLGSNAVNSAKVAADSITGGDVKESTLLVTRISNQIRGNLAVSAPESPASAPYPLTHASYTQPAGSSELTFGTMTVSFPSGCDPDAGVRTANVEIFVNGKSSGTGSVTDTGTDATIATGPILVVGGGFVLDNPVHTTVQAQVSSNCDDTSSTARPTVTSLKLDVARFR